eukprot:c14839_g1_i1 orf=7-588(+)
MEQRVLEVTLVSAKGLKEVSHLGKVRAYAEAWVDPCAKQVTPVDKQGGTNPSWNHTLPFTIPETSFHHPSALLTIHILHKSHLPGCDSFIGSASVPLHQLLDSSKSLLSCDVFTASSCIQGSICLCICLGEKHLVDPSTHQEPVMAYPAYPDQVSGKPIFQRYPNSWSYLPKGYPSMPYYPPPGVNLPLLPHQ